MPYLIALAGALLRCLLLAVLALRRIRRLVSHPAKGSNYDISFFEWALNNQSNRRIDVRINNSGAAVKPGKLH